MKEHLEEEADAKMEVERQLSKAFADIQLWKTRYETEGVARCEEIDKDKTKVAGRLAETEDTVSSLQEKIASLEKAKACAKAEFDDLKTVQRKEKEMSSILAKIDDEHTLGSKYSKQVKELQSCVDELDEELAIERTSRAKAEKNRSLLSRDLEDLGTRLEEAGSNTSTQIELNKKRKSLTHRI